MPADISNTSLSLKRTLVDVAMGRLPADLVIRRGFWVCVQSGELIPATDIAIRDGHIAYIGPDASHCVGPSTRVIEADGRYLVPGLLDGHMHVESGMLTVTEFSRAVIPHGTTGMFIDPHEITNVLGLRGLRLMVDEASCQLIHVWVQVPSCIPSFPGLETPGAVFGPEEVAEALIWDGIIGLGEMMNFPGVAAGDEKMLREMQLTDAAGKVVGGHYASPDLGLPFHGYVAGGAGDDHEGTRLEDAVARIRQGMKVMLRYGSAWHDVAAQVKAVTELGLDPRHFILCTDDSHAGTLVSEGHMDRVLRHAIDQGLDPMTAIQMCTLNPSTHFGLTRQLGMLAPGRWADVLLVKDLRDFHADLVVARGKVLAEEGCLLVEMPRFQVPEWASNSVHLKQPLTPSDFAIRSPEGSTRVVCNVIGILENQAPDRHLRMDVTLNGSEVHPDLHRDLAKLALLERHQGSGRIQLGLVHGFGFTKKCAVASTVAHDCHHLLVVGTDEADMALAANTLAEMGGGQVVVSQGNVLGRVRLEIAGLMSSEHASEVSRQAGEVLAGFQQCGCTLNNPNMQLSLLALVVIPELRISDMGLVDVTHSKLIPVIETISSSK